MYIKHKKTLLTTLISAAVSAGTQPALAKEDSADSQSFEEEVLIVSPRIVARDRIPSIKPVLSYDIEFFQRFEPVNLQDMLKRVPGLNLDKLFPSTGRFSDTEANSFGYRGSFGGTTGQILINGRRIPGINSANAVSLSAIPAELVKQINVIRAGDASNDAQGVGLTIDIILKDGSDVPTGKNTYWRVSGNKTSEQTGKNISGAFRGNFDNGVDVSFNYTLADSPIESQRDVQNFTYATNGDGSVSTTDATINRSHDNTVVDQKQKGFNLTLDKDFYNGVFISSHAYLFNFKRNDSGAREYTSNTSEDVTQILSNDEKLEHKGTATKVFLPLSSTADHALSFDVSYDESSFDYVLASSFSNDTDVTPDLAENLDNSELKFETRLDLASGSNNILSLGVHAESDEMEITNDVDLTKSDQTRTDLYGIYTWNKGGKVSFDLGYRYEITDYENTLTGAGAEGKHNKTMDGGYPSAHLWWKVADNHDVRIAATRNVNRLGLMQMFLVDSETLALTDNVYEDYDSFEIGYDHQFANKRGILGITLFYKQSDNVGQNLLISGNDEVTRYLTETAPGLLPILNANMAQGNDIQFLSVLTEGNEKVTYKGVEVDFSVPMKVIGLPDLSFSSNISYFERDVSGVEPADSIAANFTLDHKIGSFSYGVSYNIKTDETTRILSDTFASKSVFERDPSIDIFIENRFSDNFLVRLAGRNVTDAAEKISQTDIITGDINPIYLSKDKTESDPNIQLILRGGF